MLKKIIDQKRDIKTKKKAKGAQHQKKVIESLSKNTETAEEAFKG